MLQELLHKNSIIITETKKNNLKLQINLIICQINSFTVSSMLSKLNIMLHYKWHDFMISAQISHNKIIVNAVPANIRNLGIESEEIQHIQKAFQGQICESTLNMLIAQDKKQLRNITTFYDYLCQCFNKLKNQENQQQQADKSHSNIIISRQWCLDQINNNKRQRIMIKIAVQEANVQQKQKGLSKYINIKLKEVYLSLNSLIIKSNTIVLTELEYHRKYQKKITDKMMQSYKKLEEKMTKQLLFLKNQLQQFMKTPFNKQSFDSDTEITRKQKKHKKKYLIKRSRQDVKIEQFNDNLESQKSKTNVSTTIEDLKVEEKQIKYQEQQSKVLKIIQKLKPTQAIIPIPIQYDQENPSWFFYKISNKSVEKIGGFDYPMMMLKKIIPKEGTHGTVIKYILQKKKQRTCCIQVGIIDEKIKDLLHSSVYDNYIKFKFNSSTIYTKVNNKQTRKRVVKVRPLKPGEFVELRVNLGLGEISWTTSYGQVAKTEVPKELIDKKLQAFVGIYTTGDIVEFLEPYENLVN